MYIGKPTIKKQIIVNIIVNLVIIVIVFRRPCKIQCTFYCHRVVKIIAPLFVYVGPQPIGSKLPKRTQLGVGC